MSNREAHPRDLPLDGAGEDNADSPKQLSRQPGEVGRIPIYFRVGVTGHRQLDDEAHVRSIVRSALLRILEVANLPRDWDTDHSHGRVSTCRRS